MAVYNGTAQILKMDNTQLAELTNVTMSMNQDVFETTSKESGGWKEVLPGLRDITYSAEGLADFVAANKDLTDIFAAYNGRTMVQIIWTNLTAGATSVTQSAYITSCEVSAPMEDVVTYSIEFAGTGTPTFTPIV
jgi:TP901-1 family phage major tail protein